MTNSPEAVLAKLKEDKGVKGLADLLGDITPQAISQWKRVPPAWCIPVEEKTGVSRHDLRPDIFGAREGQAA